MPRQRKEKTTRARQSDQGSGCASNEAAIVLPVKLPVHLVLDGRKSQYALTVKILTRETREKHLHVLQ